MMNFTEWVWKKAELNASTIQYRPVGNVTRYETHVSGYLVSWSIFPSTNFEHHGYTNSLHPHTQIMWYWCEQIQPLCVVCGTLTIKCLTGFI
jgi:hypothetical protein